MCLVSREAHSCGTMTPSETPSYCPHAAEEFLDEDDGQYF